MRNILFYSFIVISIFLLTNCNNRSQEKVEKSAQIKPSQTPIPETYKQGNTYTKVICKNHPELSYAIYLPSSYSDSTFSPILILFDAHGRGSLPVEKYKEIADEFNLIIACSNDSKNGLSGEAINMISYGFIKDIISRFKVNKNQIFLGGFSGGARVAVQVADVDKQIKGVIGVGAGLPNSESINHIDFNYFIAAGNKDFNFKELLDLSKTLKAEKINYYFMEFDGKHEWPQPHIIKTAIYFLLLNNSDKTYTPDDDIVKSYMAFEKDNLHAAFNTNNLVEQTRIYQRMTLILNKISNTMSYQKKLKILYTTGIYKQHIKNLKKAIDYESQEQKVLSNALSSQNTAWWNVKINELSKKSTTSPSPEENLANQRLLNYLSLLSYMYADNALKNNQLANAQKYLFIYEKVDSENTEVYYLKAVYYALQNNNNLALKSLMEAVDKGFNDFERISKDPHFHFSEIELDAIR